MAKNRDTSTTTILSRGVAKDKIEGLVQRQAFELYEKRGCTPGNALADWFEAEKLVKQQLRGY